MYKLSRYGHISAIELLLDEELDRIERQAVAMEFYHFVLDVLVKALNSREKVRYTHLGDLVHYAFHEMTNNLTTLNTLFDYTVELFVKVHHHFARIGLEDFVHYRVTPIRTNTLYGHDHIKIDFEATAAWLTVRRWNVVHTTHAGNDATTDSVGQVVCETPTQEQLEALYEAQNNSAPLQRKRY